MVWSLICLKTKLKFIKGKKTVFKQYEINGMEIKEDTPKC